MLRYRANILQELKKAGYSSYRLRQEKVLSEGTLQKMRSGSVAINLESLGVICDILQCQPGELVEWVPNVGADLSDQKDAAIERPPLLPLPH